MKPFLLNVERINPIFSNKKIKIMRRHPFKFFFGLSVGLILFFFLARVFVTALFLAAAMSLVFFVFRKIKNFFKYMTWEEDYKYQDDYRNEYRNLKEFKFWEFQDEPFFDHQKNDPQERIIVVH